MDTKELECFEAVYEEKSIHKAAGKLFITSQGLGRVIRSLEEEFQAALFERSRQGVVPTEAGQLFHRRAVEILRQRQRLQEEIDNLLMGEKKIRVGLANGVLRALPLHVLMGFQREYPEIHLEWAEYDNPEIEELLRKEKLDYGLMIGEGKEEEMVRRKLLSLPMVLIAFEGHPLYEAEQVSLDMIRQEPLVTMNEQYRMYQDLIRACAIKGFVPNIVAKTADGGTLEQLCTQKTGLAILPEFGGGYMRGLRAIPMEEAASWDVWSVFREDRKTNDTIKHLDDYLKEQCSRGLEGVGK